MSIMDDGGLIELVPTECAECDDFSFENESIGEEYGINSEGEGGGVLLWSVIFFLFPIFIKGKKRIYLEER